MSPYPLQYLEKNTLISLADKMTHLGFSCLTPISSHGIKYQTGKLLGYVLGKILWLKMLN